MKYDVYLTRDVKQFMQITVDAPTSDLAETLAVIDAQKATEDKWEMESASMANAEDIRAKA